MVSLESTPSERDNSGLICYFWGYIAIPITALRRAFYHYDNILTYFYYFVMLWPYARTKHEWLLSSVLDIGEPRWTLRRVSVAVRSEICRSTIWSKSSLQPLLGENTLAESGWYDTFSSEDAPHSCLMGSGLEATTVWHGALGKAEDSHQYFGPFQVLLHPDSSPAPPTKKLLCRIL